jgi:hypothetical protein
VFNPQELQKKNPPFFTIVNQLITSGWWFGTMELDWTFHSVGNFIIPTDFNSIFFRGVGLNHKPVIIDIPYYSRSFTI